MRDSVVAWLRSRGVELADIARIVYELYASKDPDLTLADCLESVERVVSKREAQFAILTGIVLDVLAERGQLPEPLRTAIREDDPLYGIDEVLALAITNLYGAMGLTTFGYLDKAKVGVIAHLNRRPGGSVHTFLDDMVAGVAAAAVARLAHRRATLQQARPGPLASEPAEQAG